MNNNKYIEVMKIVFNPCVMSGVKENFSVNIFVHSKNFISMR